MADNIRSIEDPTVTVQTTPQLIQYLSSNPDLKALKKRLAEDPRLYASDLREVVKSIHGDNVGAELRGQELDAALEEMLTSGEIFTGIKEGPCLHDLLQGASVQLPANPVVERNPVLAARVERLRLQQNERAYQAMTKDVSPGKFYKEDTIGYQMNNMNRELIAVGQVILSVSAGFAFGFFGIPLAVGGIEFGVRILLGLLAAGIIAIAELYFLAKYMNAEDEIKDKETADGKSDHPHRD